MYGQILVVACPGYPLYVQREKRMSGEVTGTINLHPCWPSRIVTVGRCG